MIYFDNAATTYKKPPMVYRSVYECIKKYSANPGRSAHRLSVRATEAVFEARERIARFFGFDKPENVVFTYNATYALNMAIKTLIKEKCHIIISDMEHNAVLRPINKLKEVYGVEYDVYNSRANNVFSEIEKHVRPNTAAIVSTLVSNVTGAEIPLIALSAVAKKHGLKLIIDSAQASGHIGINLNDIYFDAFAAPAHKALFGIMGLGFCIFKESQVNETFVEGGSGNDSRSPVMPKLLPEGMEAGTVALPAIVALGEGISFIQEVGLNNIRSKTDMLTDRIKEIVSDIQGCDLYGAENGVISFLMEGISAEGLSYELDKRGICTRAGLHCAPLAHKSIGTYESGTVRVSVSYFNSLSDTDKLYKALREIRAII